MSSDKPNVSRPERAIRYILGLIFFTWAIAGGPTWTYFGLYLLYTAAFGTCLIYWAFSSQKKL